MKFLKWTLALLALLGVVLVGGSLVLPADTRVERSVLIERPTAEVFATLNSFRRFNEWSPWFGADPQAKYEYTGPAEGVGAGMQWSGNRAVGSGSQKILESQPNQKIVVALDFGGSAATATYLLSPEGSGTRVTWRFETRHGYNPLNRWMGLLFEKMIGGDFERGLGSLKHLLERPSS
ncbi:SRPBCC family protein [Pseudoxanthomonas indica]|uniref:Polyketide cyclase / dehydrase and lipid transport n=1 Tax=Pseudoxanthomonas indica TaxID=428993 RepID=A0A1T5JPI4_9GAMM|nr:SRPBCC family protein [Pseudoxanthomonas indica]GGD43541.1 hypothetical protein GCM10007235_14430 [Pseudoxanthomonas indica]SKC53311.1 Polyketide cyclase / dehydrase and lipid transport [Pseudoxanthomonas indica]